MNLKCKALLSFAIFLLSSNAIFATEGKLKFSSKSSSISIKPSSSMRLGLADDDRVFGWSEASIIKSSGGKPSIWKEAWNDGDVIQNSNAPTDLIVSNSWAIVNLRHDVDDVLLTTTLHLSQLVYQNSDAIVELRGDVDDVLLTTTLDLGQMVYENSRNIAKHWGYFNRSINSNYNMVDDFYVSDDRKVNFGGGSVNFSGNGNHIYFANNVSNVFNVNFGTNVFLNNLILNNFQFSELPDSGDGNLIFADGCVIELGSDQDLVKTFSVQGDVLVKGFGYSLNISDWSKLVVSTGYTLTLDNVRVTGLKGDGTMLAPAGSASQVTFRNCELVFGSTFTFVTGKMAFKGDVRFVGNDGTFVYSSDQPSTILEKSRLTFDMGVTFIYNPSTNNRDLIVMENQTSELFLDGCSLKSSTTGLRLTVGTLRLDHVNSFYNDGATSISEAISFGNGTLADDLNIEILPGGSIDLKSGILFEDNVG